MFHKCNLLTTFVWCDMTPQSVYYLNRFSTTSHSAHREAVSSARLVEAEIMSPYHGILINTGMGRAWEISDLQRASGGRTVSSPL